MHSCLNTQGFRLSVSLYVRLSLSTYVYITKRKQMGSLHAVKKLQKKCYSLIAVHLLFFSDHYLVLCKNSTLFMKLDSITKNNKCKEFNSNRFFPTESFLS